MERLEKQAKSKEVKELYEAILKLKDLEECQRFFRDLLTLEEIEEFGRRWQVAKMLIKEFPYSKITEETGMSSVTISRINYWLHHGLGGYKLMLNRLGLMKSKT